MASTEVHIVSRIIKRPAAAMGGHVVAPEIQRRLGTEP